MSIIKRYPFRGYFQGTPTAYVVHLRRGRLVHEGVGQSFWFNPATSAISDVTVTDQELPIIFHAYTLDHQDVSIQITATCRFVNPVLASQRLEFGIFPPRSGDAPDGQTQAITILTRLAQSLVVADVGARPLDQVLRDVGHIHATLINGFGADQRLRDTGLAIVDMHVLAVRPESDMEKALQMPLREQIQAEADRATFERRALAVERERAISENELASKIELATRTEQLVAQEGANARRKAEEDAAAELVKTQGWSERRRITGETEAAYTRQTGEAEAAAKAALLAGYGSVSPETLRAVALKDIAAAVQGMKIDQVTITPDLITKVLGGLGA